MAVDRAQLIGDVRSNLAGLRHGNLGIPLLLLVMLAMVMLPIPPFDGSRVVRPLFTGEWGRKWDNLDRYGLIVLLVLIVGVPMLFNVNPIAQTIGPVIMGMVNHILDAVTAISGVQ